MNGHPVGTLVRFVWYGHPQNFAETTVMSALRPARNDVPLKGITKGEPVHELDLDSQPLCGRWCVARPDQLIPIDDGREKVEWSECEWQPRGVEA